MKILYKNMKILFQKTTNGKMLEANCNPNNTKICKEIDEDGPFGCGKKLYWAEEYTGKGIISTPINKVKTLLGEIWQSHWMTCPDHARFRKYFNNRNKKHDNKNK